MTVSVRSFFTNYMTKMFEQGTAAGISQGYEEVNKKRGAAWEASREIQAEWGVSYYSLIKLGSLPIDLKARTLGGSGAGLTGRMFRVTPDEIDLVGLVDEPVWNKHRNLKENPDFELYAIPAGNILNGETPLEEFLNERECSAPIYIRTNPQTLARGFSPEKQNSDSVFDPNYANEWCLLEIKSHSDQWITAYLDIYEGELDFTIVNGN